MGAVGTWTSWTGTGGVNSSGGAGHGRTRDPRRCSGLEGPGEQILLLDLVRGVRPRGRGGGGRARHHSQRAPTSTAKFIAMKLQAPWFSGSSWTQVSEASG